MLQTDLLLRLKFSFFVKALVCIFSKVILSSNKGRIMISNKEDVQNNMKKNKVVQEHGQPVLGIHELPLSSSKGFEGIRSNICVAFLF